MDTRRMRYILAIVENDGNISKTAEKMSITQPALSQILKKVENEHGVQLFDRSKNPMALTVAGHIYVKAAKRIKEIGDSMQREFDDERNMESGDLHIGSTQFHATYVFPKLLASFHKKYPGINMILHQADHAELVKLMEDSITDITICDFYGKHASPRGFATTDLCSEEMMVFVHPDHPLASLEKLDSLDPLRDELIILSRAGEPMREVIDDFMSCKKFKPWRVVETINAEFSLRILREGVGVAIMSEAIIGVEGVGPAPVHISFGPVPPAITTSVSYPKHRYLSTAAKAFLSELGNMFGVDVM